MFRPAVEGFPAGDEISKRMSSPPSTASPALGPILVGTVTVSDLDDATGWYVEWLGYESWEEGEVSGSLAEAWQAPRAAGSRYRIVGPGAGRPGGARLIERPRDLSRSPLHHAGWRSLEIVVSDVHALRGRLEGSPFPIVGEPKGLATNPSIVAMQALGPGREMLYLTQTSQDSHFELPSAERLVDRMFISVVSAPDLSLAQRFYAERFGALGHLAATPVPLEAVNRELGMPVERPHRICALQLAGRSLVEIDEHPAELSVEPSEPDDLAGGLALVTFEHADLDDERVSSLLLAPPQARAEAPYLGRRAALLRGAAGELIELVERSALER